MNRNPGRGEAGVSRTEDPGVWGMGSSSKRISTASASVPGSPSPRLMGCFSRHYKAVSAMIEIHLDLMILFKKTGHLKPADIRQSLNIHQDQIRAVIIQTCPCSLRVQIVIRGFQQKPNFRLEIYPNTIKYFCEITRNLVNSCQIQYRTKAQHKTAPVRSYPAGRGRSCLTTIATPR